MKKIFSLAVGLFILTRVGMAQCAVGEVALSLHIYVDPWGEETYWELTPSGTGCGNETIASGSNSEEVGCGLGLPITGNYGYPDNTWITEGTFCLTYGEFYDLYFYDGYGDGGLYFELYEDGQLTHLFVGQGSGNMMTFQAGVNNLPVYDSPCGASTVLVDGPALGLNNSTAIATFWEVHPPGSNCGIFGQWCETGVSNSVWAKFTAESDKAYVISTCNAGTVFDTQIALWKVGDCNDFATYQLISSNDDQNGGCGEANGYASTMYASCLDPEAQYLVQIDGYNGESGDVFLTVETYNGGENFQVNAVGVNCPLNKGEVPTGYIEPYIFGTGSDFTCVWTGSDGFYSTDHFVYNLGPGDYTLVATDACGNTFTGEYSVGLSQPWNVVISVEGPTCPGSPDGTMSVDVSGATEPYTYNWTGPGNYSGSSASVSDLMQGTYNMTVTDSHGCTYVQALSLAAQDNFSFDLGPDTLICDLDEMLVYGPSGLSYLWQDGSTNQFFQIVGSEWGPGVHALILTASTEFDCSYTDAFVFTVDDCSAVSESEFLPLNIYPNPARDQFTLTGISDPEYVVVTDASGREVMRADHPQHGFTFSINLASGYYTVRAATSSGDHIGKLVIN